MAFAVQDEIDALATSRSSGDSTGGVHEGVLTSLLNEMDGVQELVGVTIVAATNRPEAIVCLVFLRLVLTVKWLTLWQDSALMRPGRLDRILYVGPPDLQGREEILRIRTRKMSVEPEINFAEIARMVRTPVARMIAVSSLWLSFLLLFADGRVLWSGVDGALPGGRAPDDEERHERTIRESPLHGH